MCWAGQPAVFPDDQDANQRASPSSVEGIKATYYGGYRPIPPFSSPKSQLQMIVPRSAVKAIRRRIFDYRTVMNNNQSLLRQKSQVGAAPTLVAAESKVVGKNLLTPAYSRLLARARPWLRVPYGDRRANIG
jgi:hypothetical protein